MSYEMVKIYSCIKFAQQSDNKICFLTISVKLVKFQISSFILCLSIYMNNELLKNKREIGMRGLFGPWTARVSGTAETE